MNYWRYSATGNTFIIVDGRRGVSLEVDEISRLCGEHSTDGMIFLEQSKQDQCDFHMRYVNRDGNEVEMCGNGARSIAHFAHNELDISSREEHYCFSTMCGVYWAKKQENYPLKMTELKEVNAIEIADLYKAARSCMFLNTGVPHCVFEVDDVASISLKEEGRRIRFDQRFAKGTNVNFYYHDVHNAQDVTMRTYERGVEDETQSCGTGAVAVVVSIVRSKGIYGQFKVRVPGGILRIDCDEKCENIWLAGPVVVTHKGVIGEEGK